jgi:hypothetical protein
MKFFFFTAMKNEKEPPQFSAVFGGFQVDAKENIDVVMQRM